MRRDPSAPVVFVQNHARSVRRRLGVSRWPELGLMLVAMMSVGASCGGEPRAQDPALETATTTEASREAEPPARSKAPRVERLAGVDVSDLTDPEQRVWTDLINDLLSPCGDPSSVGQCAATGKPCGACVTASRYLARLVAEGYERIEIEEHYDARFGRRPAHRFELDEAPLRGAPMAPITIVEFSDFECPYCGAAHPLIHEILRSFEGKVRLVFKHYPLASHPRAMPAALAVEAAGLQGKFWEMHDLVFANQRRLQDADLLQYAKQLGLDMERFQADFGSDRVRQRVEHNRAEGQQAGVEATPSLFINGRKYNESARNLTAYLKEEIEL